MEIKEELLPQSEIALLILALGKQDAIMLMLSKILAIGSHPNTEIEVLKTYQKLAKEFSKPYQDALKTGKLYDE